MSEHVSDDSEQPPGHLDPAAGGRSRAEKLTPEERQEIARRAAEARWHSELPKAAHGSPDHPLRIGDIEIPCYVLEDGTRVITNRGIQRGLGMAQSGGAQRMANMVGVFESKGIDGKDLTSRIAAPIEFRLPGVGSRAFGYEATVLADLCDVILLTAALETKHSCSQRQSCGGEERLNQMRFLPQSANREVKLQMQFLHVHTRKVGHLDILQMVPTSLVQRAQIGSVAGQRLQVDALRAFLRQELGDGSPSVNRRSIPNRQQFLARLHEQVLQKDHALRTRQRLAANQRIQPSGRSYSRHHRQMVARQLLINDRGLPLGAIRADHARQQVEARFIDKNQGATLYHGTPAQPGPHLSPPVGDGCFVALDGPRDRNLGRPTQFLENARNMIAVVTHAKLTGQNLHNARTRPNLPAKAIGFGSMPQEIGNQPLLLLGQFGVRSAGPGKEGLASSSPSAGQPLAHRAAGRSQGLGNLTLGPAMLVQVPCPKAAPFAPIMGLPHASYCKDQQSVQFPAQVSVAARKEGLLQKQQEHIAEQAEILARGFMRVGIIALVDEATGYQHHRARHALEEILEQFIAKELLKWAKMFPDEFYEQMFRLRGWKFNQISTKRPVLAGKLTNNLVYERLAPGVLDELRRITPRDGKGRLKHKYFQRLTEDVGHPRLREHLASVITLMRAFNDWNSFYRAIQRALPKQEKTPLLDWAESNRDMPVEPAEDDQPSV